MAEKPQYVVDKTTKKLKRYGNCDFENDGSFNSGTEEIVDLPNDGFFIDKTHPDMDEQDYYWNGSTFQDTPLS